MKKIILLYATFLFVFTSCKKDSSANGSDALSGTWKFTSLTAHTESTLEYNDAGLDDREVTTSDYTSADNAGTYTFSGGTATGSGITYSVSTNAYLSIYENNILVENDSFPFSITIPASSSVSTYKIIGTDSLFFADGFVTSTDVTSGIPQTTTPIGYKFHISGNILTMESNAVKNSTQDVGGGVLAQIQETAAFNVTLTKQ
jgi:hypothetical protein